MSSRPALRLYRQILRLHRQMLPALRALGDDYVKSEFRRHKSCDPRYVPTFMHEWSLYANTLSKQVQSKKGQDVPVVGEKLDRQKLDSFSSEQIGQLFELRNTIRHQK